MGTRNLTMVIHKGEAKVAQYGQWDGYPSGQGATALQFLKTADLEEFKKKLEKIVFANEEQVEMINEQGAFETRPYLSRDLGADILNAINTGKFTRSEYQQGEGGFKKVTTEVEVSIDYLIDQSTFAADSLFCEWAYVIDFDKGTFEVYTGFNKTPLEEGERFKYLQDSKEHFEERRGEDQYYPIRHVHTFKLDELPEEIEFVSICEPQEEEEE